MNTTATTFESSIGNLIEMDHEEAALKEQLQKLALRKEEAKRTGGEKVKEELQTKIPDARVTLFGLLRTAQNLSISLEGEYGVTLRQIVEQAGATGVALSLVQEVLPDLGKLQSARDQLGKNGTGEIVELKAKEHLKEGKGRGLYLVWEGKEAASDDEDSSSEAPVDNEHQADDQEMEETPPRGIVPIRAKAPVKR